MRHAPSFFRVVFSISMLAACGDGMSNADAGDSGGGVDSGRRDSGPPPRPDSGPRIDGGPTGCTEGCEIVEIALGVQHGCGRRENGEVMCWGRDEDGQLGDRDMLHDDCGGVGAREDCSAEAVNAQIDIAGPMDIVDATRVLARGYLTTCAIRESGELWCWGYETLPTGAVRRERQTAEHELDLTDIVDAGIGSSHICYVTGAERALFCYGANDSHELGANTSLTPVRDPLPVLADLDGDGTRTPLTGVDQIVAAGDNSCALVAGSIWCWGSDDSDQLGDNGASERDECSSGKGMPYDCSDAPVQVVTETGPLTDVTQFAFSGGHGCAITEASALLCWGDNRAAQLTGDALQSLFARPIDGIDDAEGVAVGSQFTCVLHANGSVSCWGWNLFGSLGDGEAPHENCDTGTQMADCSRTPVSVATIDDATAISASGDRACAIREDGSVWCWGANRNHEAGGASMEAQFSPVRVAGIIE
jgi:alpha-tubulin suppressor-like RCC1 family protein